MSALLRRLLTCCVLPSAECNKDGPPGRVQLFDFSIAEALS